MNMTALWLISFSLLVLLILIFYTFRPKKEEAKPSLLLFNMLESPFTKEEKRFFKALHEVVQDDADILAKIRIHDLLSASNVPGANNFVRRWLYLRRIGARQFDFILCKPETFSIMAVISLNEKSDSRETRDTAIAEEVCRNAGIPFFEFTTAEQYNIFQIHARIYGMDNKIIDTLPEEDST